MTTDWAIRAFYNYKTPSVWTSQSVERSDSLQWWYVFFWSRVWRFENEWKMMICWTIVLIAKYTEYHLPSHIPYLEHTQIPADHGPRAGTRRYHTDICWPDLLNISYLRSHWEEFSLKKVRLSVIPWEVSRKSVFWWCMVKLANEAWRASEGDKKCKITVWNEKTKTLPLFDRC